MEDTIMKKTYINPVMNVVKIETQMMLAASKTTLGFGSGTQDGGAACSREFEDFDDCED